MGRKVINARQLLETGKRWFAKPPVTHQSPSPSMMAWTVASANVDLDAHEDGFIGNLMRSLGMEMPRKSQETFVGLAHLQTIVNIQRWLHNNGPTIFVEAETVYLSRLTDSMSSVHANEIK